MERNLQSPLSGEKPKQKNIDGKLYELKEFPGGVSKYVRVQSDETPMSGGLRAAIQPQPRIDMLLPVQEPAAVLDVDQLKNALAGVQDLASTLEQEIAEAENALKAAEKQKQTDALRDFMNKSRGPVPAYPVYAPAQPQEYSPLPLVEQKTEAQSVTLKEETLEYQAPKKKMSRRRRLGTVAVITAGAVSLTAGGLALTTNTFGFNATNTSISPDKSPTVDPATIPDLAPATIVDAFGGCLDERGAGPALYSGKFDATVTSSWKYKDPSGAEYPLAAKTQAGDYFKPTTSLTETPVRYTACVEAANRESVIKIEGDRITVDYSKVSPQIYVDVNKKLQNLPGIKDGFNGTVDLFIAGKGMTAEEGARLKAAYADGPNKDAELAQARMRMAEVLSDEAGAYAQQASANTELKIEAAIKKQVEDLYNKGLSKYKEAKVDGIGKIDDPQVKDPMLIKNPVAANSNAFTLDKDSTKILQFTVNADGSTEATK